MLKEKLLSFGKNLFVALRDSGCKEILYILYAGYCRLPVNSTPKNVTVKQFRVQVENFSHQNDDKFTLKSI